MGDERTVSEEDKDDLDDESPTGIAERLERVSRIIAKANARLDRIAAHWADPPEPGKPPIRHALASIKTEAQGAIKRADALAARLR